jgi:protein-L-isoaspartate(D-aspartate) O-methyltransferase
MQEDSYKLKGLREQLVRYLTQEKKIKDTLVLEAIRRIPRHVFLPEMYAEESYKDKAMPIGDGQTISQPYTVARQSELLELKSGMKVLEIGTGSGYQCSILCAMGMQVYSVERHVDLHHKAKSLLSKLGFKPRLRCGDGSTGWDTWAPFDRILVTAGSPDIPQAYVDQLANGGILVIPVGNRETQQMKVIRKDLSGKCSIQVAEQFRFVPLIGKQGWQG